MLALLREKESQRRGTSPNQVSFNSFNIVKEPLFFCKIDSIHQACESDSSTELKCWRERLIKRRACCGCVSFWASNGWWQTPGLNLQHIAAPARF
jgi:hypothetical protein